MYKNLVIGDEIVIELDTATCPHCAQWVGIDPEMYEYCNRPVRVRQVYHQPVPICGATQFGIEDNSFVWAECWIIFREGYNLNEPHWEV